MGFVASGSVHGEMGHDGTECEPEHGDSPHGGQKDRKCPPRDEPSRMRRPPGTLVAEVGVGGRLADYSLPSSPLCVLCAAIRAARMVEEDGLSLERRVSHLSCGISPVDPPKFSRQSFQRLVLSHLLPPPGSHSKASLPQSATVSSSWKEAVSAEDNWLIITPVIPRGWNVAGPGSSCPLSLAVLFSKQPFLAHLHFKRNAL